MTTHTENIVQTFLQTDFNSRLAGAFWYSEARELAAELDPSNPARAAGIIAALSPMNSWPRNISLAKDVYSGITPGTLSRNVAKAMAIYNGADPLYVLSGEKVTAFYRNIMGDPDAVTIDRHAIDVACGKVMSDNDRSAALRKGGRKAIHDAYVMAAGIISKEWLNVTPAELQAIVWVWWRKNMATAYHA